MRNYREVHPSVIKHPSWTRPQESGRTLAAARVTGRRAPSSPCAAVRRSATHQSTSSRSVPNFLRWCLSGDPRRRSSPGNAFVTPTRVTATFAAEARGADEGEAKQTSTSRSRDGELTSTSSQSMSIRPIAAAAADRPAIGEERDD